jgi:two-component system chemotaxis response regulator CheY
MKSLIVEDDNTSRLLLERFVSNYGPTASAKNGVEGVQMYRKAVADNEPFDVIFMDIMMPEMNGQEALKMIRNSEEANALPTAKMVKIVMTTAIDKLAEVRKAYFSLCDGYLVKPINQKDLQGELLRLKLLEISLEE